MRTPLFSALTGTFALALTLARAASADPPARPVIDEELDPPREATTRPATVPVSIWEKAGLEVTLYIDGQPIGPLPWSGALRPGRHELSGSHPSRLIAAKTVVLEEGHRAAIELVAAPPTGKLALRTALSPDEPARDTATPKEPPAVERPTESARHGMVGSLLFAGSMQLGRSGSEVERRCDAFGPACSAPPALGGGLVVSMGLMWKHFGFDVLGAALFDSAERRVVDRQGFTVQRLGGLGALRLRASIQSRSFRATLAAGPGAMVRLLGKSASVGLPDDTASYSSLAFTADLSGQWRIGDSTALALGVMVVTDHAGEQATTDAGTVHLASGPQASVMPYLGFQFGP